jgi:hypothetical protein
LVRDSLHVLCKGSGKSACGTDRCPERVKDYADFAEHESLILLAR